MAAITEAKPVHAAVKIKGFVVTVYNMIRLAMIAGAIGSKIADARNPLKPTIR